MIKGRKEMTTSDNDVAKLSGSKSSDKKRGFLRRISKKVKIVIIAVVLAVLVIIIVSLVFSALGKSGMRKSEKLAKKIGEPVNKASAYAKVEFQSALKYDFLDGITESSLVVESGSDTDVYGVKLPSWCIFCTENTFGNLGDVTYYNFDVLSDNINGVKKESKVDVLDITVGTTEKDADEILDMEPYQICYLEETKVKKYKYYCEDNINDSIEAYYITVMFNDKNVVNAPVIEEKNDFISDILRPSSE